MEIIIIFIEILVELLRMVSALLPCSARELRTMLVGSACAN